MRRLNAQLVQIDRDTFAVQRELLEPLNPYKGIDLHRAYWELRRRRVQVQSARKRLGIQRDKTAQNLLNYS